MSPLATFVPCPDGGRCGSDTHDPRKKQLSVCRRNSVLRRMGKLQDDTAPSVASSAPPVTSSPVVAGAGVFSSDRFDESGMSFYGRPPRQIQVEPLKGLMGVLDEDGKGQMIAACGTGKSYMSQQVLRQYTTRAGSNGIAVILTSSINLAEQTADGLRADGNAFGIPGDEFMVIEVHSRRRKSSDPGKDDQVIDAKTGAIDENVIAKKIEEAKEQGIPVIIVSTYDSADKVTAGQKIAAESLGEKGARADIMIADEAHNILGPRLQPSEKASITSDDADMFDCLSERFGSFTDEDGGIQSDRRAFFTATPVTRTVDTNMQGIPSDAQAVYSNDFDKVGRVGGVISMDDAVSSGALVGAQYVVNGVALKGNLQDFVDPVVAPDGTVVERKQGASYPDPDTYAAIYSSLDEMVIDDQSRNVLMFVTSRAEAEAVVSTMKDVASHRAGGMTSENAALNVNSDDPGVRRRARMRLIADEMDVRTAHFQTSNADRKAALDMFRDKDLVESSEWRPDVNVLANINILSEGVDVPEIDSVVFADRSKTNERSMTQAVGRAMRTLPSSYSVKKRQGKVIIPSISDDSGSSGVYNSGFVARAIAGADMVQKAVTARRLSGQPISRGSTKVRLPNGKKILASDMVSTSLPTREELAAYSVASKITLTSQWIASQGLTSAAKSRMDEIKPGLYERAVSDDGRLTRSERSMALHAVALAKYDLGFDDEPALGEYVSSAKDSTAMRHCVDKMAVLESVLEGGQVDLLSEEAKEALLGSKILVETLKPLDELSPDIRAQAEVRRRVCADRICKRIADSGKISFGDPRSEAVIEKAIGRDRFSQMRSRIVSETRDVGNARNARLQKELQGIALEGDIDSIVSIAQEIDRGDNSGDGKKRQAAIRRAMRELSNDYLYLARTSPDSCELTLSSRVLSKSKKGGLRTNSIVKALLGA